MEQPNVDALVGLCQVSLAIVTRDDTEGYACGEAIALPSAARFTREPFSPARAVYSDDGSPRFIHAGAFAKAELRLAGVDPELLVTLNLWQRGSSNLELCDGLPCAGRKYALRFTTKTLSRRAYVHSYRVFLIEEVRLETSVSRGAAQSVSEWILTGTLQTPKCARFPWWNATII